LALFTLADLHLSFTAQKPMDVFGGSWVHYEKKLKEYWEYMVLPEDSVVMPGDISWGMTLEEAKADLKWLHSLPGEKYLMKGNHDYWWSSFTKLQAFAEEEELTSLHFLYHDAAFTQGKIICGSRGWLCDDRMTAQDQKILNREAIRFALSLEKAQHLAEEAELQNGTRPELICFSHYPILTATQMENPIMNILHEYSIKRVYYGHLHNWGTKPLIEEYEGISFTLVSSDYRSFTPVRID
jgi:predicted phosphohydrolase